MSTNEAVMGKLRKLLAMATPGRGASQAEVETAMAKANELALEHNISLSSVDADGDIKVGAIETDVTEVHTSTKIEQLHHLPILRVLGACFDVEYVLNTYTDANCQRHLTKVTLIGEKTDVAMATYCWAWLEKMFPAAWLTFRKEHGVKEGWVARRSFMVGFGQGITVANMRAKEAIKGQDKDRYALVLVNKDAIVEAKKNELFPNLRSIKSFQTQEHSGARAGGFAAGRAVRLVGGLTGGASNGGSLK